MIPNIQVVAPVGARLDHGGVSQDPPVVSITSSTRDAMQQARRWLVWRLVPDPDPTKKPRKVPHYINGTYRGETDTPDDAAQLATYQQALAVAHWYSGIGFALGNGWQGIDFDEVPTKCLSDLANTVAGYVELSPSETGCHAIGYGRQFRNLASNKSGIEAYCGKRFFTFTGVLIRDAPLTCLADYVERVLTPRHGVAAHDNHSGVEGSNGPEVRSDGEIWEAIERAANFQTIAALCRGDALAYGADRSSLDAKLMQHLVFHSPNNEQVLRLFKTTPLAQRDKVLVRKDYILRTLSAARIIRDIEIAESQVKADALSASLANNPAFQKNLALHKRLNNPRL